MKLVNIFAILVLSGCSLTDNESVGTGVGAAAGAGAGIAISSAMGQSSLVGGLVGAAVGAPLGMSIGTAYDGYVQRKEQERLDQAIQSNQAAIVDQQRALDRAHQRVLEDSQRGDPREDTKEYIYTGPSIGNYYR